MAKTALNDQKRVISINSFQGYKTSKRADWQTTFTMNATSSNAPDTQ
jgi:hypothetical protein